MKINEKLNFKECLMLLNILHRYVDDYDCDGQEIVYIGIEKRPCKGILNLIYPSGGFNRYMKEYDIDNDYNDIDITGLWGDICSKFDKEIWWSRDNGFYVRRWYHKLIYGVEQMKKNLKHKLCCREMLIRLKFREWKRNRQQRKYIKALCKYQNLEIDENKFERTCKCGFYVKEDLRRLLKHIRL
jgi:hypothetical protein